MLPERKYEFKKIRKPNRNCFTIYGDNLHEALNFIREIEEYNNLIRISFNYISLNEYLFTYEYNNQKLYFICSRFYQSGALPKIISNTLSFNDKPDIVVYSNDKDEILLGAEITSGGIHGNQSWQRNGRILSFITNKIPFFFISFYSKVDRSAIKDNVIPKPRKPSDLFIISHLLLSSKYKTPSIVAFTNHSDLDNSISYNFKDLKIDAFKYIFSLIINNPNSHLLTKCYSNMIEYCKNNLNEDLFSKKFIDILYSDDFLNKLSNKESYNFSNHLNNIFIDNWSLINKWKDYHINSLMVNFNWYALTKSSRAGFLKNGDQILKEIKQLNNNFNLNTYSSGIPAIILPIKVTKKNGNKIVLTDDPYNGEVSAFMELYRVLSKFFNDYLYSWLTKSS